MPLPTTIRDDAPSRPAEPVPVNPAIAVSPGRSGRLARTALLVLAIFVAGVALGRMTPGSTAAGASGSPDAAAGVAGATLPPDAPADFDVFWQALQLIRNNYVRSGDVTDEQLTWGAIRGMVDALGDTGHTRFLSPDELKAEQETLQGKITGIGVIVDPRSSEPEVISVVDGGPAQRAGIRVGDIITSVDGKPTDSMRIDQVISQVRGPAGTTVSVGVRHRDGSTDTFPIVRAQIDVPAASWSLVPGTTIADVSIVEFWQGSAEAVKNAVSAAMDAGATGIVLDLRGNPGGLVDEAIRTVSLFLEDGIVYEQRDRAGKVTKVPVVGKALEPKVPLTVLVDHGSASSSEITAAALQDSGRAKVVGEQTYGTGTVLVPYQLSDGSALQLGVLEWLTPSGKTIFEAGITPDIRVALPDTGIQLRPSDLEKMTPREFNRSTDTQLQRAVRSLRGGQ
jgi:carboxyl-terminal processing protease